MKKLISLLCVCFLLFTGNMQIFANNVDVNYTVLKGSALSSSMGEYVPVIENALGHISGEQLKKIDSKVSILLNSSKLNKDMRDFLIFIELIVSRELAHRNTKIQESPISLEEQKGAEAAILTLQSHTYNLIEAMYNSLVGSWEDLTHYRETGDMKLKLSGSVPNEGELEMELSLSDYIAETNLFDQRVRGDIEAFLEAASNGSNASMSLNANIDFIQKGSKTYIKIGDANGVSSISDSYFGDIDITPVLKKLNELAQENIYLVQEDQVAEMGIQILNSLSPDKVMASIQDLTQLPLLEAYSKTEGGYLLQPTQHFCSSMKELMEVFDPFGDENCSESQYKDMLADFHKEGIELMLGSNMKELHIRESGGTMSGKILWDMEKIEKIEISGVQGEENMSFIYTPSSMSLDMNVEGVVIDMDVGFNSLSGINEIIGFIDDRNSGMFMDLAYKNSRLNMVIESEEFVMNLGGLLKTNKADLEMSFNVPNENISGKGNLNYDGRYGKNNFNVVMNGSIDNSGKFAFELLNIGEKTSIKNIDIPMPENIKSLEEFSWEISGDLYNTSDADFSSDYSVDFEIVENEYDDYSETCYNYENGESYCSKYYDDRVEYCDIYTAGDEATCESYYYDDEEYSY